MGNSAFHVIIGSIGSSLDISYKDFTLEMSLLHRTIESHEGSMTSLDLWGILGVEMRLKMLYATEQQGGGELREHDTPFR